LSSRDRSDLYETGCMLGIYSQHTWDASPDKQLSSLAALRKSVVVNRSLRLTDGTGWTLDIYNREPCP
jgi:hypothetical protein